VLVRPPPPLLPSRAHAQLGGGAQTHVRWGRDTHAHTYTHTT
jgi:hypothetical protein